MTDPVAKLVEVRHRYGATTALDLDELAIPSGGIAGLIGPDGVGKSTLLGLVAGVTKLQSGRLDVLGVDMSNTSQRRIACGRIAYMPQGLGRNLYPTLSVAENLHFFGRLFGQGQKERNTRIAELLAATGLSDFADRPAGKLSGGMKQKLSICAALIHDPDLLILDEPTTGVDPLSRRQFWQLIDAMRARRPSMSTIVATAYMEEAERFDWLAAVYAGKVLASGTPADLKRQAGEPDLDRTFIHLLPEAERAHHVPLPALTPIAHDGPVAIEAEGLTCRFGPFTAVDHVSFRIGQGEIFGFLGSNGSGKSTTMKMLTGLLPATEGVAKLFGQTLDASDMSTRRRVGYMSQSFSLYGELTVGQNLFLHARLFQLPKDDIGPRVEEMLNRFDLKSVEDKRPDPLPLGQRQRLQLAVAMIHRPEILILDEPTSGVDPIARDSFWSELIRLSRDDGVTIFLSTHFMNEAERCDRISLMHHGKVLAVGSPAAISTERKAANVEDAFISVLEEAGMGSEGGAPAAGVDAKSPAAAAAPALIPPRFDFGRLMAYAWREMLEIRRDPLRLAFAFLGPLILMLAFGYGISFDVEHLSYAAFDQDQSTESRQFLEAFEGSRYFDRKAPIATAAELDQRLKTGELKLAIEVPSGFGSDLIRGLKPEVGVWVDGGMTFRAETIRGYVSGLTQTYLRDQALQRTGTATAVAMPIDIETRFRYNQAFRSVNAMVPSVMVLMLVLIPAIMTAIGVVKEKETGSISNFQSTPVTRLEFLVGKQLPYAAIAYISFFLLTVEAFACFSVPVKGSYTTLALAALLYVLATTAFGLLISTIVRTQVAAIFATAIIAIIPAVNFSGLLVPVSALSGGGRAIGLAFPAAWFQPIAMGVFAKGLAIDTLWLNIGIVGLFAVGFLGAANLFLSKQGK
ncbi:MAG: ribosome-associated ATPase/putative transporter RbbA [Ancalomicrobiaceae bacterium]|nr:ribosome-associated ATPase/putative transporter RbbA [Ancalomicrobiaceae bacterium]